MNGGRLKQAIAGLTGTLLVLTISAGGANGAVAPPEVLAAGKAGLPKFLAKVPAGSKQSYGFPESSDLSLSKLGAPVLLETIRPGEVSSKWASSGVSSVLLDTTMWFFPVRLGTEGKAMLLVSRQNNEWNAVSFGYAHLAREWDEVLKHWPEARGYHPRLIAVFQASRHYFNVPEVDDRNFTLIAFPGKGFNPSSASSLAAQEDPGRYSTLGSFAKEIEKLKPVLRGVGVKTQE
jgi:hypothetical protein